MTITKGFATITTLGLVAGVALNIHLYGDSRFTDGQHLVSRLTWWENTLNIYAAVAIIVNAVVSAFHAFFQYNRKWVLLNILISPISFYYVWRVVLENNENSKENT